MKKGLEKKKLKEDFSKKILHYFKKRKFYFTDLDLLIDMVWVSARDIGSSFRCKNIFYLSDKETLFDTILKNKLENECTFWSCKFHSNISLKDFKFYSELSNSKNYSTLALSLMVKDVVPQKWSNIVWIIKNFFVKYKK